VRRRCGALALMCVASGACSYDGSAERVEPKPSITENYWLRINERALAVPEGERAWPLLRRAHVELLDSQDVPTWLDTHRHASLMVLQIDQIAELRNRIPRSAAPPSPDLEVGKTEYGPLVYWLDAHADFLEALRAAAVHEHLAYVMGVDVDQATGGIEPPANPCLLDAAVPHLAMIRRWSAALIADAELALSEQDSQRAVADLRTAIRMVEYAAESPTVLGQLVAISVGYRTAIDIRRMLIVRPETGPIFRDAQIGPLFAKALESIDLRAGLDGEAIYYADTAQRVFTDDGAGDGVITFDGLLLLRDFGLQIPATPADEIHPERLVELFTRKFHPATRRLDAQAHSAYLQTWREILGTDPWLRPAPSAAVAAAEVHALLDPSPSSESPYAACAGTLLVALDRAALSEIHVRCQVQSTLLALALDEHRATHGSWPHTLTDLDPAFAEGPFIDAFTGEPLLYRLTEEGPIVYSAGADRDDDGGRPLLDKNGRPAIPPWVAASELADCLADDLRAIDGDWILYPPQP